MKLHRNLVEAVAWGVQQIFFHDRHADKVIESMLKSNPQWGVRDRGFIAENTYEIVRWWRLLVYAWNREKFYPVNEDHINRITGIHLLLKYDELPDWDIFKEVEKKKAKENHQQGLEIRAIRESMPDWLDARIFAELGEAWDEVASALNIPADPIIRVNSLRTSAQQLIESFEEEHIPTETIEGYPDALRVLKKSNLFIKSSFQSGWFEMQDASSQLVAPFLDITPGMRVVDACAGAGGKSLHIAALLENKGKVISMDVEQRKLDELKRRSRRAGISIIETRLIENSKTIKRLDDQADRVLLDVPCSGLGVLKRNPDSKWKLTPEFLDEIRTTQADILQRYSEMVKPGGKLVYATCSILPSENTQQVLQFLNQTGDAWEMEAEKIILPGESEFDGFYMARLKRNS